MRHDPGIGIALAMAIAADMRSLVDDENLMASLGQGSSDDRAAEAGSNNTVPDHRGPLFCMITKSDLRDIRRPTSMANASVTKHSINKNDEAAPTTPKPRANG